MAKQKPTASTRPTDSRGRPTGNAVCRQLWFTAEEIAHLEAKFGTVASGVRTLVRAAMAGAKS